MEIKCNIDEILKSFIGRKFSIYNGDHCFGIILKYLKIIDYDINTKIISIDIRRLKDKQYIRELEIRFEKYISKILNEKSNKCCLSKGDILIVKDNTLPNRRLPAIYFDSKNFIKITRLNGVQMVNSKNYIILRAFDYKGN